MTEIEPSTAVMTGFFATIGVALAISIIAGVICYALYLLGHYEGRDKE